MKIKNGVEKKEIIVINQETGEIIEEKTIFMEKQVVVNESESFLFWYENTKDVVSHMKASDFKFIFYVMFNFGRDQEFYLNKQVYDDIELTVGLKKRTVLQVIPDLMKLDVIRRINRGFYMINPNYFYMGSSKKRINMYSKYLKIKNDDQ